MLTSKGRQDGRVRRLVARLISIRVVEVEVCRRHVQSGALRGELEDARTAGDARQQTGTFLVAGSHLLACLDVDTGEVV